MQLEITIWNDKDEVVVHEFVEAQTATDAEIESMVALINGGMPACIASKLVIAERNETPT